MSPQLLIVDSDIAGADGLCRVLALTVGPCTVVPDAYQALARLADGGVDALVTEFVLPGASGTDLLERADPAVPAIVVTASYSEPVAARARAAGARAVLRKPVDDAELVRAVRSVLAVPTGVPGSGEAEALVETGA